MGFFLVIIWPEFILMKKCWIFDFFSFHKNSWSGAGIPNPCLGPWMKGGGGEGDSLLENRVGGRYYVRMSETGMSNPFPIHPVAIPNVYGHW